MKLGVNQSPAQSDATNIIPCLGRGAARLGCRIITFAFAVLAAAGTVGLLVVRLFWLLMVRLRSRGRRGCYEFFGTLGPLGERWGWGVRRGAAGAVHPPGCDRPHAAQVPAVQGVHGQFIDRVLDISVVLREGTHSANCAEDCSWRRRPCDQQRHVPAVQRFESSCPRFSSSSEW